MSSKRITGFVLSSQLGFYLDLADAPGAITVTPHSGDVLFHEGVGDDRLEHVGVSGRSAVGFRLRRAEGAQQLVFEFRRGTAVEQHVIGTPEDIASAQSWIDRVNALYEDLETTRLARSRGRSGAFADAPVIADILADGEIRILRGRYLNSAEGYRAHPYDAEWLHRYAEGCKEGLSRIAGPHRPVELVWQTPPSHQYQWLVDRIDYDSHNYKSRITLPLEIIFDRAPRRDRIRVVPLGTVTDFAIVFSNEASFARDLPPGRETPITATFDEFVSLLRTLKTTKGTPSLCSMSETAVDFLLTDAIARDQLDDERWFSITGVTSIAEWLNRFSDCGIVACDVGVAYEIKSVLKDGHYPGASYSTAFVPYDAPIPVGLAYKKSDPVWGAICAESIYAALDSADQAVTASWRDGQRRMSDLRIRTAA